MPEAYYPYGGIYAPFGRARRNEPVKLREANPLPVNAKSDNTGDAGLDGYTVKSRADRHTGERPFVEGAPQYMGPNLNEEI
jgi:hypothetical protein